MRPSTWRGYGHIANSQLKVKYLELRYWHGRYSLVSLDNPKIFTFYFILKEIKCEHSRQFEFLSALTHLRRNEASWNWDWCSRKWYVLICHFYVNSITFDLLFWPFYNNFLSTFWWRFWRLFSLFYALEFDTLAMFQSCFNTASSGSK